MRRFALLLAVALLLASSPCDGKKKKKKKSLEEIYAAKRAKMVAAGGDGGLVSFDEALFDRIVNRARDFTVVLVFTARRADYGCTVCATVEDAMRSLAATYSRQKGASAPHEVFFAAVDVDEAREVFTAYDKHTAPHVFVLPPQSAAAEPLRTARELNHVAYSGLKASKLAAMVNERAPHLRLEVLSDAAPPTAVVLLLCMAVAMAAQHARGEPARALGLLRARGLWLLLCVAVFAFGVSGSVSCIIRGTPLYGRYRSPVLISEGGRDQFVLEGLSIALLSVAVAAALLLARAAAGWRAAAKGAPPPVLVALSFTSIVITTAAAAAFVTLAGRLAGLYLYKTRWYQVGATVPPMFSGLFSRPVGTINKSTGILERLRKFAWYVALDARSPRDVGKKARTLFLNYARRAFGLQ